MPKEGETGQVTSVFKNSMIIFKIKRCLCLCFKRVLPPFKVESGRKALVFRFATQHNTR